MADGNMELAGRWRDLEQILTRPSNLAGPGFEPGPELLDFLQVSMLRGTCLSAGFRLIACLVQISIPSMCTLSCPEMYGNGHWVL